MLADLSWWRIRRALRQRTLGPILALALILTPILSAQQFSDERYGEMIVEGHTVFTVLQQERLETGFDIVILARELRKGVNVLWFNDQWKTYDEEVRHPCGGFLFVAPEGVDVVELLRRLAQLVDAGILEIPVSGYEGAQGSVNENVSDVHQKVEAETGENFEDEYNMLKGSVNFGYVESYRITDPNGFESLTNLYFLGFSGVQAPNATRGIPVWVSSVFNAWIEDDGVSNCPPATDTAPHASPPGHPPYQVRNYNADIFGLMAHTPVTGNKLHSATTSEFEETGCEEGTEWECVYSDDQEGNSHPYNPINPAEPPDHNHLSATLSVAFVPALDVDLRTAFRLAGGFYPDLSLKLRVDDGNAVEVPCSTWTSWDPEFGGSCL